MPLVKIHLLNIWSDEEIKKISDLIHDSLVEAFKIPEYDYNHRIIRLNEKDFIHSGKKSDKNILVEITAFPGRSKDAKKKLYSLIFTRLKKLNIPETDIMIVLYSPPLENWAFNGKPGDEADIGFNINV